MARTAQQQLDDIDSALAQIEKGAQSYTMPDGQTVVKADYAKLQDRRRVLELEVAGASRGGMFTRVSHRRPV